MTLTEYAKRIGIHYRTAWNHFHAGLIDGAYRLASGSIIVPDDKLINKNDYTVVYARVSSSENKDNLKTQSSRVQGFCAAKGWVVNEVIEECGSGLNDTRPKLMKVLGNPLVTRVVVEHKDRLTRFGFNYINELWSGEIIVINNVDNDEKDLMQDFVSLVTSFTARLYGRRRSKRNTEKIIRDLELESENKNEIEDQE